MSFDEKIRKSLSELPYEIFLLEKMLGDRSFNFVLRNTNEAPWRPHVRSHSSGFNPFRAEIYVSAHSPIAEYVLKNYKSNRVRDLNIYDAFVRQMLFLLHDYLHIWAYGLIKELQPMRMGFLKNKISDSNFDNYLFFHLLSEAVATVGLDYWYLSCIDIDDELEVGSTINTLTTKYRLEYQKEYYRSLNLDVQSVEFFENLAQFYCSGIFFECDINDIRRSPRLYEWLQHELTYGQTQRIYTRQWFYFLKEGSPIKKEFGLGKHIKLEKWQRHLIKEVGKNLFAFVKEGKNIVPKAVKFNPRSKKIQNLDLRFVGINSIDEWRLAANDRWISAEQFDWLVFHLCTMKQYPKENHEEFLEALKKVIENKNVLLLDRLFRIESNILDIGEAEKVKDVFLLA